MKYYALTMAYRKDEQVVDIQDLIMDDLFSLVAEAHYLVDNMSSSDIKYYDEVSILVEEIKCDNEGEKIYKEVYYRCEQL